MLQDSSLSKPLDARKIKSEWLATWKYDDSSIFAEMNSFIYVLLLTWRSNHRLTTSSVSSVIFTLKNYKSNEKVILNKLTILFYKRFYTLSKNLFKIYLKQLMDTLIEVTLIPSSALLCYYKMITLNVFYPWSK